MTKFCLQCLKGGPEDRTQCPECGAVMQSFAPPDQLVRDIEKRQFLIEALEQSHKEKLIDEALLAKLTLPHREMLKVTRLQLKRLRLQEPVEAALPEAALKVSSAKAASLPLSDGEPQASSGEDRQAPVSVDATASVNATVQVEVAAPPEVLPTLTEVAQQLAAASPEVAAPSPFAIEAHLEAKEEAEESAHMELIELEEQASDLVEELLETDNHDEAFAGPDFGGEHIVYSEEQEAVLAQSTWSTFLKPFLVQNWLYFLGVFLVLASGFYLVSLVWDGMTDVVRQGVVWGGLGTAAFAFAGGGAYLYRKLEVEQAGQIFWLVGAGLLGAAAIAAGQTIKLSLPLWCLMLGLTLALGVWLIRLLRPFDRGSARYLTAVGMLSQFVMIGCIPLFQQNEHARVWIFSFFYIGGVMLWQLIRHFRLHLVEARPVMSVWGQLFAIQVPSPPETQDTEESTPKGWEWLLFIVPVGYSFVVMLFWAGWQLRSVFKSDIAIAWYGPLLVLIGLALVEIELASRDKTPPTSDKSPGEESQTQPMSLMIGTAIGVGVLGFSLAFAHPPTKILAASLLTGLLLWVGWLWPRRSLYLFAGLSALVAYEGLLWVTGFVNKAMILTHPSAGIHYFPFLGLLFGGILLLYKRKQTLGADTWRVLFLLLSLTLFGLMLGGARQESFYLLAFGPLYIIAYLALGSIYQAQWLGWISWVMMCLWFSAGVAPQLGGASSYALSMICFAVVCALIARVTSGQENRTLQQVYDAGFVLCGLLLFLGWSKDPLWHIVVMALQEVGLGANATWTPSWEWLLVYVGYLAYGGLAVLLAWQTAHRWLTYGSLFMLSLGGALLGVAVPRALGWPVIAWHPPLAMLVLGVALFECARRLHTGVAPLSRRVMLFGVTITQEEPKDFWSAPTRRLSYLLTTIMGVMLLLNELHVLAHIFLGCGLLAYLLQAGVRQKQHRFGYISSLYVWYIGYLSLSWLDQQVHLGDTFGFLLFLCGGSALLGLLLLAQSRLSSANQGDGESAFVPLTLPLTNMLPVFITLAGWWLISQTNLWLVGQPGAPELLFMGWLALAVASYALAQVSRCAVFVMMGAGCLILGITMLFVPLIAPLHLLLVAAAATTLIFALGTLPFWEHWTGWSTSNTAPARLWDLYAGSFRGHPTHLWASAHRLLAQGMSLIWVMCLSLSWVLSQMMFQGETLRTLKPIPSQMILVGLLLSAIPFFWQGQIIRRKSRKTQLTWIGGSIGVLAISLGCTPLMGWLGYSVGQERIWPVMLAMGLLFPLFGAALIRGLSKGNEQEATTKGLMWSYGTSAFLLPLLYLYALWHGATTQEGTLWLMMTPFLVAPLLAPDKVALLWGTAISLMAWYTGVASSTSVTLALLLMGGLHQINFLARWDQTKRFEEGWHQLAILVLGLGFGRIVFALCPPAWTEGTGLIAWVITLSVMGLLYHLLILIARLIDPPTARDTWYATYQSLHEKLYTLADTPEREALEKEYSEAISELGVWEETRWFEWRTHIDICQTLISGLAYTLAFAPFLSLYDTTYLMWGWLPFVVSLPLLAGALLKPSGKTISSLFVLLLVGTYFTTAHMWGDHTGRWSAPFFTTAACVVFLSSLTWLLTTRIKRGGPTASEGTQVALWTDVQASVEAYSVLIMLPSVYVLWTSLPLGVLLVPGAPSGAIPVWMMTPWFQVGTPLVFLLAFLLFRNVLYLHLLMLVSMLSAMTSLQWLHQAASLPAMSPSVLWACLALVMGFWRSRLDEEESDPSTVASQVTLSTIDADGKVIEEQLDVPPAPKKPNLLYFWNGPFSSVVSFWSSVAGIAALAGLLITTTAYRAGPLQWLGVGVLVTLGWVSVALRHRASTKWVLQASLAVIWSLHGLCLLALPNTTTAFKNPALFALLSMFVGVSLMLLRKDERADIDKATHHSMFWLTSLASVMLLYSFTYQQVTNTTDLWWEHVSFLVTLGFLAWSWVRMALIFEADLWGYLGVISFLSTYAYLRVSFGIIPGAADAWVLLVVGFLATGFRVLWRRAGGERLQRVVMRTSFVLPIVALIASYNQGFQVPKGIWLASGLFYVVIARQYKQRWIYVPALIFGNIEVFKLLAELGHVSASQQPQWYAIPVGLTLFGFAAIYQQELGRRGRHLIRNTGALLIYASSLYQVVALSHITDIMLLALLAILGVIIGIISQIRSYLYMGSAFLVMNIGLNLFRIGMNDRIIGMVFLFVTGLLVLATAVYFNLKREEILRQINKWRSEIAQWD